MPDLQAELPSTQNVPEHSQNRTEVFAVHGADPEVLAYAALGALHERVAQRDQQPAR